MHVYADIVKHVIAVLAVKKRLPLSHKVAAHKIG